MGDPGPGRESITSAPCSNDPSVGAVKRPAGRPFVDYSSHDPEGNIFNIAESGKKQLVGVFTGAERSTGRR